MYEIDDMAIQVIKDWILKISKDLGYTEEEIKESNNVYRDEKDVLRLAYQSAWQLGKAVEIVDEVLTARIPVIMCNHGILFSKYCKYCEAEFIKQRTLKKLEMRKYYLNHREDWNNYVSEWQKKHPDNSKRKEAKRKRSLGFIPLNKPFKGSVGHHIDREYVVYIPEELHKSIRHSILRNENMNEINEKALEWFNQNI